MAICGLLNSFTIKICSFITTEVDNLCSSEFIKLRVCRLQTADWFAGLCTNRLFNIARSNDAQTSLLKRLTVLVSSHAYRHSHATGHRTAAPLRCFYLTRRLLRRWRLVVCSHVHGVSINRRNNVRNKVRPSIGPFIYCFMYSFIHLLAYLLSNPIT